MASYNSETYDSKSFAAKSFVRAGSSPPAPGAASTQMIVNPVTVGRLKTR